MIKIKQKLILLILLASLSLLISSCAPAVPNVEYCVELEQLKGHCFFTVSSSERDVLNQDWINLRNKALVVPVDSWTKIRQYILDACKSFNNCDSVQLQKKIEQLTLGE